MSTETDRIEKKIVLRANRDRVWRALSNSQEFGSWFGMTFDGPFVEGQRVHGAIIPTKVDPEVAKKQAEFEGLRFELIVERLAPQKTFAFRWHPAAVERGVDYSAEPMTLVTFELEDAADGILLTVIESGFDAIPLERRAKAFASNTEGWSLVIKLLEAHLGKST